MSFKASLQFIVQIHDFLNIDLPQQGTACISISIYQQNSKTSKIYANPFQLAEYPQQNNDLGRKIVRNSFCDLQRFYSKMAIIKYLDQRVIINDIVRYKLDIQAFPNMEIDDICMEVQLLFSPKYLNKSKTKTNNQEVEQQQQQQQFDGKVVATKKYKLLALQTGLFNYFQVQFSQDYISKCGITIFGCISKFKFGKYKLHYIEQIMKESKQGEVTVTEQNSDPNYEMKTLKEREIQRLKINTFEQMLIWVQKYHTKRINNPLLYFYSTYVKNLRYYFSLIQQKSNKLFKIPTKTILKVPKHFINLPDSPQQQQHKQSQTSQHKIFRTYMTEYIPNNETLTSNRIISQLHEIYYDIYQFLIQVQKQFVYGQVNYQAMKKQYETYIKDRYSERVFKSIAYAVQGARNHLTKDETMMVMTTDNKSTNGNPHKNNQNTLNQSTQPQKLSNYDKSQTTSEQNKRIAKKMRSKQCDSVAEYPIIDMDFIKTREMMEYVFYEVTYASMVRNEQMVGLRGHRSQSVGGNLVGNSGRRVQKCVEIIKIQDVTGKQKQQQKLQKQIKQTIDNDNSGGNDDSMKLMEQRQSQNIQVQQQESIKIQELSKQQQQSEKLSQNKQSKQGKQSKQSKQSKQNDQDSFLAEQTKQINSEIFGSQISDIDVKKRKASQSSSQNHPLSKTPSEQCKSDRGQKDASEAILDEKYEYNNTHNNIFQQIIPQAIKIAPQLKQPQFLQQYNQKNMLIIMCHGFQGSSYDMMLIYRGLKQKLPDANYLVSRANQQDTTGNIDEMGKKLSIEIINYIRNYMDQDKAIINMVGHSMGGIIARAGLKYLEHSFMKFGFYFSLSSPHLGYLHGVDQKIKAGLWLIRKFSPMKSLQQLSMQDTSNPRKTLLYRLSRQGSLKKFMKVILWSSFEDSYVAWNSARILVHPHKKKTSSVLVEEQMTNNILGACPVHRIDINFNVKKNTIDALIGRTAHINLIVQESLFKIINSTLPDLFDLRKP